MFICYHIPSFETYYHFKIFDYHKNIYGGGLVAKSCPTHVTPWTVVCQAPLCVRFSKNTGVGCHFLFQGIFPTQGSNPVLLHCKQILY